MTVSKWFDILFSQRLIRVPVRYSSLHPCWSPPHSAVRGTAAARFRAPSPSEAFSNIHFKLPRPDPLLSSPSLR